VADTYQIFSTTSLVVEFKLSVSVSEIKNSAITIPENLANITQIISNRKDN